MNKVFYVYAYLDPRKPGIFPFGNYCFDHEPIYIGKGKNGRAYQFNRKRENKYLGSKLDKISRPIVIFIKERLSESEAFDEEKQLISVIGRYDLKVGPLANQTDGGDGASGNVQSQETIKKRTAKRLGSKCSDETKKKLSEMFKGRPLTEETKRKISKSLIGHKASKETIEKRRQKMLGHTVSEETRRKIAAPQIGRVFTDEQKRNMSIAHKGKKHTLEQRKKRAKFTKVWWGERKEVLICGKR